LSGGHPFLRPVSEGAAIDAERSKIDLYLAFIAMKFAALTLAILSLSAMTLFASTSNLIQQEDLAPHQTRTESTNGYGHQTGVISSVPLLDGRAWVIHTPDGRCFDPMNLPDSLKREGTKINFSYKSTSDWGYIYACGDLIELTQVSRAK
jgi:hypothetical protein